MTDRDPSAYDDEYVVHNMDEMYQLACGSMLYLMDPRFVTFKNHYEAINVGCGCNKKKRIAAAKSTYRDLTGISPEAQLEIRRGVKAYKVTLKDGSETIASFG